jgi:hypothetical protein
MMATGIRITTMLLGIARKLLGIDICQMGREPVGIYILTMLANTPIIAMGPTAFS